jgi:hypothetical protein
LLVVTIERYKNGGKLWRHDEGREKK